MGRAVSETKCPICNICKGTSNMKIGYSDNLYWGLLHSLDTGHEVEVFIRGELVLRAGPVSYTGQEVGLLDIFGLEYKGGLQL